MKIKNFLAFIFAIASIVLHSADSYGQKAEKTTITGTVLDRSGHPIPNIQVVDTYTRSKTTTDASGRYAISAWPNECHLRFSRVGYKTENRVIEPTVLTNAAQSPVEVLVVMRESALGLPIGSMDNSEPLMRYAPANAAVMDFSFISGSDHLLLLVKKGKKTFLQRINSDLEVITEKQVSNRTRKILQDCLGNVHLDMGDDVGLIVQTESSWHIISTVSRLQYDRVFSNCVAVNDDLIVFRQLAKMGSEVKYFGVSRKTRAAVEMVAAVDHKRIQDIYRPSTQRGRLRDVAFDEIRKWYSPFLNPELIECIEALAANNPNWIAPIQTVMEAESSQTRPDDLMPRGWVVRYDAKVASAGRNMNEGDLLMRFPLYCPLFTTTNGFVFFDHLAGRGINFHADGSMGGTFPIDHHRQQGWKNCIEKDEITGKFYARGLMSGLPLLAEINTETGGIASMFVLKSGQYPDEIKIRGGKLFFTDIDQRSPYPKLFVLDIHDCSSDLSQNN